MSTRTRLGRQCVFFFSFFSKDAQKEEEGQGERARDLL